MTEAQLAEIADAAIVAAGVPRIEAARRIGSAPPAVTRALDVAKYPTKGHGVRRALLREFAQLDADGPLYRLVRVGVPEQD